MYLKSIEIINFVTAGLWVLRGFPVCYVNMTFKQPAQGHQEKSLKF